MNRWVTRVAGPASAAPNASASASVCPTATVAPEPLVKLVEALSTAFGLVLGLTGAAAALLLISVASSVMVVSV